MSHEATLARLIDLDDHFDGVLDATELVVSQALNECVAMPVDLMADPHRAVAWLNAYHAIRITAALREEGLVP